MTKSLSIFEQRLVSEILQLAELKFQQENEINPKATYNILKVLSAYNEVLPRHGISPTEQTRLYNYLLHLSKKHDPQCKEEWRLLIDTHRTLSNLDLSRVDRSRAEKSFIQKSLIENNSRSNKSISKSMTKSPIEKSRMTARKAPDSQVSEFNNLSNKQLVSAQISSIGPQPIVHSNQLFKHYRERSRSSFDNKENQMYRINASNSVIDINKTTASQRYIKMEQSGHFGAPVSKTLILEEDNDQEAKMNQRATTAYKINMFTKAFLILKATCLIHDEARNRLRKILKFSRLREVQKYFRIFGSAVEIAKVQRLKVQSALQLHRQHVMSKVLNLFRILRRLEIRQEDTEKLQNNPIAIDFILSLATETITKEPELRERFDYFEQNGKYQELSLMFKVFGRVQPQCQTTLLQLLKKRQLIRVRKLFSSWKSTTNTKKTTVMNINHRNIKKKIMRMLKQNLKMRKQCNNKLTKFEIGKKSHQMQLFFNHFKTFSAVSVREAQRTKRIEQVTKYNKIQLYMRIWKDAIQSRKSEILKIHRQKIDLQQSYEKQLKKYVFYEGMVKYLEWRRHKKLILVKAMAYKNAKSLEKVWKTLISRVLTKKKMQYLNDKNNQLSKVKPILNIWRKSTAVFKIRRTVFRIRNRMVLQMLDSQVESKRIADQYRLKFVFNVFKSWKLQTRIQKKQIQAKTKIIHGFTNQRKTQFFKSLRLNHQKTLPLKNILEKMLVRKKDSSKVQAISQHDQFSSSQVIPKISRFNNFFKKLRLYHSYKLDNKLRKSKTAQIKSSIIRKFLKRMFNSHKIKNKIKQTKYKADERSKIDAIRRLKLCRLNQNSNKSIKQLQKTLKTKIISRRLRIFITILKGLFRKSAQKCKIAQNHFNKKLQETTFLLMRSVFIVKMERKSKHHQLIQKIYSIIKSNTVRRLKIGSKFLEFHSAMQKLTTKRINTLIKHNSIRKIREFTAHSQQNSQDSLRIRKLVLNLFRRRMKNRRYADLRERTLQKYIHFNRFIRSVYIYLEDRKILQLAMYHAAHQVMRKAFLAWQLSESQQNHNSTVESQNRLPIYDMINYYKHK